MLPHDRCSTDRKGQADDGASGGVVRSNLRPLDVQGTTKSSLRATFLLPSWTEYERHENSQ